MGTNRADKQDEVTAKSLGEAKSLSAAPSKREMKMRIYINNVPMREEVVYDLRGRWALNQFTNAIQEESERGVGLSDEDLETMRNL